MIYMFCVEITKTTGGLVVIQHLCLHIQSEEWLRPVRPTILNWTSRTNQFELVFKTTLNKLSLQHENRGWITIRPTRCCYYIQLLISYNQWENEIYCLKHFEYRDNYLSLSRSHLIEMNAYFLFHRVECHNKTTN